MCRWVGGFAVVRPRAVRPRAVGAWSGMGGSEPRLGQWLCWDSGGRELLAVLEFGEGRLGGREGRGAANQANQSSLAFTCSGLSACAPVLLARRQPGRSVVAPGPSPPPSQSPLPSPQPRLTKRWPPLLHPCPAVEYVRLLGDERVAMVKYATPEGARHALATLNGSEVLGEVLQVRASPPLPLHSYTP